MTLVHAKNATAATAGSTNATNVTLVHTPSAITVPIASTVPNGRDLRLSEVAVLPSWTTIRSMVAKRTVSSEFENGRRRNVNMTGEDASRRTDSGERVVW